MIGMHIPDGFINGPTSLAAGLVAIAGVAWCVKKTSQTLDDREIEAGPGSPRGDRRASIGAY
jgi:ABC-type Co2+ transport system permease subunit